MRDIVIYSTGCPKCKIAEQLLNDKGITFIVVYDSDKVNKIAEEHGFTAVPFAKIGEEYLDSNELFEWINNQ